MNLEELEKRIEKLEKTLYPLQKLIKKFCEEYRDKLTEDYWNER